MIRCYHVTGVENLNSIFACGLLPEKFQDGVVWLFKRSEDVTEYLKCAPKTWGGDNAVVECSVPSYQLKRGDWPAWREYYSKHRVLPNRIIGARILTQSLTGARAGGM